jgi:hypothetical protein
MGGTTSHPRRTSVQKSTPFQVRLGSWPFQEVGNAVIRREFMPKAKHFRCCLWRIVISPVIPQDFPPCYHASMRHLVVLFIHFLATLVRLLGPGGVRSIVAESLLLRHQLLIVNRSRQRSPNLCAWDRILAGWMALLVRPTRLLRSAIVLKPSTLLALHKAMSKRKYRMLFSPIVSRRQGLGRQYATALSHLRQAEKYRTVVAFDLLLRKLFFVSAALLSRF